MRNWLKYLWQNEDGFFGIGQGPSLGQQREAGLEGMLANFATGEGEGDILASDNFFKAILSGDPAALARVAGPELGAITGQSEQEKKTASEFHNRGGGTNAFLQSSDQRTRSSVDQLIASLTGGAASHLGSEGASLLNTGSSAHEATFNMASVIQKLKAGKWNDIFKSIADVATGVAGGFGGGGDGTSLGDFLPPTQISGAYGGPKSVPTTTSDVGWKIEE